jgi:hypothetical protein
MCLPVDRTALQCWLRSQLAVLGALRDEAALQLEGETRLSATLAGHHAWLMRELELIGDDTLAAPAIARA